MTFVTRRFNAQALAGLALAVLTAGTALLATLPAEAQTARLVCHPRDNMLAQLEKTYGEVPVAIGVANGALVELLTAEDGITWTIIMTSPKGVSCLIASGEGWRPLEPAPTGPTV